MSGQTIRVVAESGPGYEYRWDLDGDRRWDGPYGAERTRDRQTRGPGRYVVRLQIRSPFGESRVESRSVEVRP